MGMSSDWKGSSEGRFAALHLWESEKGFASQVALPDSVKETRWSGVARLFYKLKIYINFFIWLHRVLVAAHGIFSCGLQTLSCSTWDLVPRSGVEPSPPALGAWCLSHWTTREISYLEFS